MDSDYSYTHIGQNKMFHRTVRNAFFLTEDERLIILFILDRTISWGRVREVISPKEFVNGIFRKKAGRRVQVAPGTSLRPEKVRQALDSLINLGAVEVNEIGSKKEYNVAEDWCHPRWIKLGMPKTWSLNEGDYIYPED